jgi:hypothetical protein
MREGKVANPLEGKTVRRTPEKVRFHGIEEQAASVTQKSQAAAKVCGQCVTAPTKAFCQAGSVPGSGVSGNALCGREGTVGFLGGANSKGRWVQALLSSAPESVEVACLPNQGKVILREEAVSDKGVYAFNAKVELYNCREWLKRIRGEVDAGLQRLDMLLKDVDITGLGQGRMGKEWAPKPKRTSEPRGKKLFIPKASSVGRGLGPIANGQPRSSNGQASGMGLAVGSSGRVMDRPGMGDSKRVGSPARASSSHLGESGSGLSSEMVGMKDDVCAESTSKRGGYWVGSGVAGAEREGSVSVVAGEGREGTLFDDSSKFEAWEEGSNHRAHYAPGLPEEPLEVFKAHAV